MDQKSATILKALHHMVTTYKTGGFQVTLILGDSPFEALRGPLSGLNVILIISSNNERVLEIVRYIITVKEQTRAIYNNLPFKKLPPLLFIEMVHTSVCWLYNFPAEGGISDTLSPRTMITRTSIDFNRHCKIEFGAYVQTHEAHNNSMNSWTVGALAIGPTGNVQGGYHFYNLNTGKIINRNHWMEFPMPSELVTQVEELAKSSGLTIDDPDDDLYEIAGVSRNST